MKEGRYEKIKVSDMREFRTDMVGKYAKEYNEALEEADREVREEYLEWLRIKNPSTYKQHMEMMEKGGEG